MFNKKTNEMRKYVLSVVMIVTAMLGANAQRFQKPNFKPEQRAEKQVKRLDEKLNLTDEQEKQVKAVYEEFFKEQASSREESKAKRDEMDKKIESFLTDEQRKAYEEMKKERKPNFRKIILPHMCLQKMNRMKLRRCLRGWICMHILKSMTLLMLQIQKST